MSPGWEVTFRWFTRSLWPAFLQRTPSFSPSACQATFHSKLVSKLYTPQSRVTYAGSYFSMEINWHTRDRNAFFFFFIAIAASMGHVRSSLWIRSEECVPSPAGWLGYCPFHVWHFDHIGAISPGFAVPAVCRYSRMCFSSYQKLTTQHLCSSIWG